MGIGNKIGTLLKEQGRSAAWLSRETGIPATTIRSAISRDASRMDLNALKQIADALNCRWPELLGIPGEDEVMKITKNEAGEIFTEIRPKDEAEEEQAAKDEAYINKLAVPALKLNDLGRKLLLDNAETMAANAELVRNNGE